MGAFATVSLEDRFNGFKGRIGTDGALRSAPCIGESESGIQTLTTSWAVVLAANTARRQVQIQNQSPTAAVYVWLKAGEPSAVGYRIDPGVTYSFPPGVAFRGEIQGKASASADVCVIEFAEPEDPEE